MPQKCEQFFSDINTEALDQEFTQKQCNLLRLKNKGGKQ